MIEAYNGDLGTLAFFMFVHGKLHSVNLHIA